MSWLSKTFNWERDREGNVWYQIGNEETDWELGDKLNALLNNPVTFRCVDLISDLASQAIFKVGESDSHWLTKLLDNPNPLQSKQDFLREHFFFNYAYGWDYQYPVMGVGAKDPTAIFNLNPAKVKYNKTFPTRLIFAKEDVSALKEKQFVYKEDGQERTFSIEEVVPFFDIANGLSEDFLLKAPSRLKPIQKNIRNIDVALTSESNALSKAGRWIVSSSVKGAAIARALKAEEKQDIEKSFGGFGLGKKKGDVAITTAQLDAKSLHIPLKDLAIPESVANNALLIMNVFGLPQELFPVIAGSGAKYDNFELALVALCQNVVQNKLDDLCGSYKSHFKIDEPVTASIDHLPCMQVIERQKADEALKLSTAIRNLTGTNIDPEQFLENLGINMNDDDE